MTRRLLVLAMATLAAVAAPRAVTADPGAGKPATPAPARTKLAVTSLAPNKGDVEGGTYVRVKGSGFLTDEAGKPLATNALKVYFGSRQGTVIRFQADDELILEAPGGKPGETVDLLFEFDGRGEIKVPAAFTFVAKKP